jgi:pimeloyl-ACP methyl ester carboxylesterase
MTTTALKPLVVWMGGWVSSLGCWETQLRAAFPDFDHEFVDTHAVLDESMPPAALVGSLGKGASRTPPHAERVVAAWSLGSLRVHRWIAEGVWPVEVPVLSLCPVFRFVQPGTAGTFGESILLRMEQKLGMERETVLRDFWRRMPKASAMPPDWEAAWIEGTRRYDDKSVLRALQYLRLEHADLSALTSVPQRWELIAGVQDRLAPLGAWTDALPRHARLTTHAGGHIPFWECPELMAASLDRLLRRDQDQGTLNGEGEA